MVQSVELLLNEELEDSIRSQWRALHDAGLPCQPLHARPHVTIGVAHEIYPRIERHIPRALGEFPLAARIGGLLVFGDRRMVLARAVTTSASLLTKHESVYALLRECPGRPGHMAPGQWTPHVTLARKMTPQQVSAALPLVATRKDLTGTFVGARRWDGTHRTETIIAHE
ncbi:2'-5' RNA ligase family protein [Hoyosella sp. YIM 151337]|uniref:2'-5' RNA ligase family protein n=1 Tax=Hoyosella sp. YIM 151337 TaxID=2992742 RepID=UPI0022366810|nr:2'-5' RNA ligase family protein [Hoyosella sp. YIM 151337]MCW4355610.1 2'-5' RNA ligase family protein [Hoyosella sp. YIM 151337]